MSNMSKHIKALKEARCVIYAGFFSNPVASVMTENEFGTPNIPARPFMRAAFSQSIPKIKEIAKEILDDSHTKPKIGLAMADEIRNQILHGAFIPNAPFTIEKKGFDHPLLDSADALNSVDFKVE